MLELGLEYGYITTGEAFISLQVREANPQTLYCYLSIPDEDAQISITQTAVSQVMSICLITLQSRQRDHF